MRIVYYVLTFYAVLYFGDLGAQTSDTLPSLQLSYGFNLYTPGIGFEERDDPNFISLDHHPGVILDVEARARRGFSWLGMLGTHARSGRAAYGNLPIAGGVDSEGSLVETRDVNNIDRHLRHFYLGLGGQGNLRIGRGDLSLGAVATVGFQRVRDIISIGDMTPIFFSHGRGGRPPRGFPHSSILRYAPVWQLGGRGQLSYTYWVDQHFALRAGVYVHRVNELTLGNYDRRSPDRYELNSVTYTEEYDPAIHRYDLPPTELINPGDPTVGITWFGFTFGMIYKPGKTPKP